MYPAYMHLCLALIRMDFDINLTIVYIFILLFMFTVMNWIVYWNFKNMLHNFNFFCVCLCVNELVLSFLVLFKFVLFFRKRCCFSTNTYVYKVYINYILCLYAYGFTEEYSRCFSKYLENPLLIMRKALF